MSEDISISKIATEALKVLRPLKRWEHRCHQASITLVKAGVGTRVARGWCNGVIGQHS